MGMIVRNRLEILKDDKITYHHKKTNNLESCNHQAVKIHQLFDGCPLCMSSDKHHLSQGAGLDNR